MKLTPYKSVNKLLKLLLTKIPNILNSQFIGLYIQGSLALGDFVLNRSDIDLVVVTKTNISTELLEKVKSFHQEITSSNLPYSKRMECIYIPLNALENYDQDKAYFPCLHVGGDFYIDGFGIIEKHVLREKGIVLKGPNPKSFIKPVSINNLKKAATVSLTNWWLPKLKNHSKLKDDDYQVYAILTMCRVALYN